jgi:hypothetical protein
VKWLVIIVILIVIVVGMLWLRTVRQGPDTVDSRDSHRLDESLTPPGDAGNPLPPGGPSVAGGATGASSVEPPSEATWASEEAGSGEVSPPDDLPPSESHPNA